MRRDAGQSNIGPGITALRQGRDGKDIFDIIPHAAKRSLRLSRRL